MLCATNSQIVVSDNSDEPLTENLLKNLDNSGRLVYQHHVGKLSVVDNFERALALATGEYLIFIGDDDCVGPNIEDIVQWAKEEQIDAVVSYRDRFVANYFWPGIRSKYFGKGYEAKLFIAKYSGEASPLDTRIAIRDAARRPGHGLGSMARAYHGIVSRELINRVVARYGSLFGGVSPDIYSATLLSYEASRAYLVDFPFVIPGASPKSTAGEGAAREDTDRLKGRDHITRFGDSLCWDERIPEFYSPHTVWAFSQLQALDRLADSSLNMNFSRLYLCCAIQYRSHHRATLKAISSWHKNGGRNLAVGLLCALGFEFIGQFSRVWYRFVTPPRSFDKLKTVGDAYAILEQRMAPWSPTTIISEDITDET